MLEDEDDCEYDHEPPFAVARSSHRWVFVAALFELISDIFMAFYKLTTVVRDSALQKYRYDNDRIKFMDQVAVDIETITSGGLDASTPEPRSG